MKRISLRFAALMATMMMTMTMSAKTQDWGGRVIDENGEPMPFVNVVLLSPPDSAFVQGATTDMFENGILTERSASYIWQDQSVKKHIFNAYYNGKVGQLGIDLNIDGLFDDTKTPGRTTELTTAVGPASADRTIESNTNSGNNFWASKLIFSYPILKGNLSVGGEYSYNHRTDAYTFQATDAVPVKSTDTEINEKSSAIFLETEGAYVMSFVTERCKLSQIFGSSCTNS